MANPRVSIINGFIALALEGRKRIFAVKNFSRLEVERRAPTSSFNLGSWPQLSSGERGEIDDPLIRASPNRIEISEI